MIKLMPGRGRTLKKNESYEVPINPGKLAAEEWLLYNYGEPPNELKKKWGILNAQFIHGLKPKEIKPKEINK